MIPGFINLRTLKNLATRSLTLLIGLVLLSLSISHTFYPNNSLLANGVPLGPVTLPEMHWVIAVIFGLVILPRAVIVTISAVFPRSMME